MFCVQAPSDFLTTIKIGTVRTFSFSSNDIPPRFALGFVRPSSVRRPPAQEAGASRVLRCRPHQPPCAVAASLACPAVPEGRSPSANPGGADPGGIRRIIIMDRAPFELIGNVGNIAWLSDPATKDLPTGMDLPAGSDQQTSLAGQRPRCRHWWRSCSREACASLLRSACGDFDRNSSLARTDASRKTTRSAGCKRRDR